MTKERFLEELRAEEGYLGEEMEGEDIIVYLSDGVSFEEEITVTPYEAIATHRGIGKGFIWTKPSLRETFYEGCLVDALEKGRKDWENKIEKTEDVCGLYTDLYNIRSGNNYSHDYILGGMTEKNCKRSLLDMVVTDDHIQRLVEGIEMFRSDTSNYAFSYVTRLGYGSGYTLWDEPSLNWLSTWEGYHWVASHC